MTFQTALILLSIASPVLVASVGWLLKRAIANSDAQRDKQTLLIEEIYGKVSQVQQEQASQRATLIQHDQEIGRFRTLLDRWNKGPFGG